MCVKETCNVCQRDPCRQYVCTGGAQKKLECIPKSLHSCNRALHLQKKPTCLYKRPILCVKETYDMCITDL